MRICRFRIFDTGCDHRMAIFVSFRCVDEVVIGAPYTVTKALMDHFSVSNKLFFYRM